MLLIGITGVIGSGKSTIGNILKKLGYTVYDMDIWCRKMYKDPHFLSLIKSHFPFCFYDHIFDKKLLRECVFNNLTELKKLEKLTHPYLKQKFIKTIQKHHFDQDLVFIQSALLFQMSLDKYCSDIIITTAPENIIKNRVIKRDGVDENQIQNILKKQYKNNSFSKGWIIDTNQKLTTLKVDVIKTLQRIILC